MAVALAGGEAGGHAGLQKLLAGVGDEGELAFEHIDELVFMAVPVALRGGRAWRQAYQVHAEGIEAQRIAQRPLLPLAAGRSPGRSEEHTSELQSLMRISYAVFCLQKKHSLYFTFFFLSQYSST